jgi:hypothetical protein
MNSRGMQNYLAEGHKIASPHEAPDPSGRPIMAIHCGRQDLSLAVPIYMCVRDVNPSVVVLVTSSVTARNLFPHELLEL